VAGIGKIVCVGLNYADHAEETGAELPEEPVLFLKTPDTVIGPDDEVLVPRGSERTDYEVELAVVIGRTARYLASPNDADPVIAGYAIAHDVSEREFQLDRGGQWDKGKNWESTVRGAPAPDGWWQSALGLSGWPRSRARSSTLGASARGSARWARGVRCRGSRCSRRGGRGWRRPT
jgi:hypothetical protein